MSSYDNRYNDIDDEPDFDYVNDDYGFDIDDDKEPSARTSSGASKNNKKKKASKNFKATQPAQFGWNKSASLCHRRF